VQDELAVRRPTTRVLVQTVGVKQLLGPGPIRGFAVQVEAPLSIRGENNDPPIRRPDRLLLHRVAEGEAAVLAARQIVNPDVRIISLAYGRGDALLVRRDLHP